MKNFKDYCNDELDWLTLQDIQKTALLNKTLATSKKQRKRKKVVRISLAFACMIMVTIGITYDLKSRGPVSIIDGTEVKLENSYINFPKEDSKMSTEAKIVIPEEGRTEWSYEQICDYFGKDIGLSYVPDYLNQSNLKQTKTVYLNAKKEVVFDNIEFVYWKMEELQMGPYLSVLVSKGKMPTVDTLYYGAVDSYIGDTKIRITKMGASSYQIAFMYDNIGYMISTAHIKEWDIVQVLQSILK